MKKALGVLLALALVSGAFAAEPKPELKVSEFTGSAAVLFGADLDTGAVAFKNEASASLKLDIMGGGDKATSGSDIWGELKIKTDGDPIQIKADSSNGAAVSGYKVVVDVAKLNFGNMAYLGIKKDGTSVDYVMFADMAAPYFKVDNTKYYGQLNTTYPSLLTNAAAVGPNAQYGVVLGVALPKLVTVSMDFRSFDELKTDGSAVAAGGTPVTKNAFGFRAKATLTAVDNLTLEGAFNTGFGGENADYETGFGAKIGYKLSLTDTYYVKPTAAFNGKIRTDDKFAWTSHAGVLLGWGNKAKTINTYFFNESDADWGYYPGISVGATIDGNPDNSKMPIGLNVSMMTGSLIQNLTAAVAFEVQDLQADNLKMGVSAVAKYAIKQDPMTITPKAGINFYSDAAQTTDKGKTDIYIKAGLDIEKIFPNTTLSFEYASNDLNGGVNNGVTTDKTMGLFYTKLKISL
ncbi:MAG: hypothetical protein N2Z76_05870 [Treponemataceae bacterium]|nr:hypothetical protein [Treponemataceae bacterium]